MKIEPGTLCIVRQSFVDKAARGLVVMALRLATAGETIVGGPSGEMVVMPPAGWLVEASCGIPMTWYIGVNRKEKILRVPQLVIEEIDLTPISGPGLDLSEQWPEGRDLVAEKMNALKVARLMGDATWD